MTYFTSDQHYGHTNIIKYCDRPFSSVEEMNETIIAKHNSMVKEEDIIYFLGDFVMSYNKDVVKSYFNRLNGEKHLIMGNHDRLKPNAYRAMGFKTVQKSFRMGKWQLTHYPAYKSQYSDRKILHGHTHSMHKLVDRQLNVSVEAWDYCPVSLSKVEAAFGEREL